MGNARFGLGKDFSHLDYPICWNSDARNVDICASLGDIFLKNNHTDESRYPGVYASELDSRFQLNDDVF